MIGNLVSSVRRGAGHPLHPAHLARKLAQAWRRRRAAGAYREALARGDLLEVPSSPPAEIAFTVATPVYRVTEGHLRAAIASVRAQTHPHWELVLLDDASPDPHVGRVLAAAARDDDRIKVLRRRDSNGGIAVASDEILRHARGEFVAFLDHDDLLHPRALETAARSLAADPGADWLFSDEDKVDERGRHGEPCLKPGWSRHLLLAFNYVAHLRIVRRALLERLGGHRPGFEGAQDYDLALRALAAGARFVHLPGVLYHWRTVAASMARLAQAKPRAHAHALRALADHARTWPRGGEVSSAVLLAAASLFRVRRDAAANLRVGSLPFTAGLAGAELIAAARESDAEIVVVSSAGGMTNAGLAELLALLQVPGTAIASGRCCTRRGVVTSSGWVATDAGNAWDPWAGLAAADPAYLNLALVPGRRALPAATGWAAWRDALLAGWEVAPDAAPPWRLAVGLARLGVEVVATPETTLPLAAPAETPPAPPSELPRYRTRWVGGLGLGR